jgi:hypothetical protein
VGADIERIIAELTSDALQQTIVGISRSQPPDQRESVMLNSIWDALAGTGSLEPGASGWTDYLAFKQAVMRLVGLIPRMRFVEADS